VGEAWGRLRKAKGVSVNKLSVEMNLCPEGSNVARDTMGGREVVIK
jgi:hypothetical protein